MIKVIGVGNPLMGDDGVGIALVDRLLAEKLPPEVEVIDGGTGGITLLGLMEGAEGVILVDAADMGRPVGTVLRVQEQDVRLGEPRCGVSLHESGLDGVLTLGRELGILPRCVLFLVQGAPLERRQGLSPSVGDALECLVARVKAEVLRMGR